MARAAVLPAVISSPAPRLRMIPCPACIRSKSLVALSIPEGTEMCAHCTRAAAAKKRSAGSARKPRTPKGAATGAATGAAVEPTAADTTGTAESTTVAAPAPPATLVLTAREAARLPKEVPGDLLHQTAEGVRIAGLEALHLAVLDGQRVFDEYGVFEIHASEETGLMHATRRLAQIPFCLRVGWVERPRGGNVWGGFEVDPRFGSLWPRFAVLRERFPL